MTFSTTIFFPDINVWVPLAYAGHPHHGAAEAWVASVAGSPQLLFARWTQMGLLRMLTNRSMMGADVLTLAGAWQYYDGLLRDHSAKYLDEPAGFEAELRRLTSRNEVSTKDWSDSYLLAFARLAGLTFVTFDRALAARAPGSVLLRP